MRNTVKRVLANYRTSRVMLYGISLPLLALSVADIGSSTLRILWVLLGFSLIIFLHELGHFLVARACSVKCLAFSLGIGPRMFGWRKGGKFSFGADPYDHEAKKDLKHEAIKDAEGAAAVADLPQSAVVQPHPANVGDCDYRVSWLPLGGYVRMLGQDDMDPTKISNDPRAFNKRPIWQRMCIVSAGVIMNLIFAAVTFSIIFSPGIGVDFPPAEVGQVVYNSPAEKAGMQMGDKIISIDGETPIGDLEFTDVVIASALSTGTRPIEYKWIHKNPDGTQQTITKSILPVAPPEGGNGFLTIGLSQMPSLKIVPSQDILDEAVSDRKKSKADGGLGDDQGADALAQFKIKDIITAINGQPVSDYVQLYNAVQKSNGEPVKVSVVQPANPAQSLPASSPRTITLLPHLVERMGVEDYPSVFGMGPRIKVLKAPDSGTPADKAGIHFDDIILGIGERSMPNVKQFRDIVTSNGGKSIDVRVLRGGDIKTLSVVPKEEKGRVIIGVALGEDKDNLTVAPREDSNEAVKKITASGAAKITAVDGHSVKNWDEVLGLVKQKNAGDTVAITFDTPAHAAKQTGWFQTPANVLDFTINTELAFTLHDQLHYMLDLPVENKTFTQKAGNMFDATVMGMQHTKKFVEQVYMTLRGIFNRTVSTDNLHGIVGIARVGYTVQERGMVWLWYVLALVSVNLAVANFLPLPIVDGGLFLLLILEKLRGKPLSLKIQSVIQTAGIVLLAGLFLYVTYNDIFGPAFTK